MFGKLMKHELLATGRVALPILGGMALLSLLARLAISGPEFLPFGLFTGVVTVLYAMSYFAAAVGMAILLIQRFRRSVLGDEGCLTMTLPVSLHAILCAKALTAVLWCVLASALAAVCGALVSFGVSGWREALDALLREGGPLYLTPGQLALAAADGLAGLLQLVLLFYAAMAVGHSFHSHRTLWSVAAFFLLNTVIRGAMLGLFRGLAERIGQAGSFVPELLLPALAGTLAFSALLYVITWYCLSRRLNLE